MLLQTQISPFVRARTVNQTSNGYVSKIPTITEPAADTGSATPTNWTLKDTQAYGAGKTMQRFEKLAASEGANWTFNNAGGTPVGNESSVYCICTSPGHTESEGGTKGTNTGTSADAAQYTTLAANDLLLVCWAMHPGISADITPDASLTALAQIGSLSGQRTRVGYKSQVAAGGTADTDATLSESAAWAAMIVAIAPAAGSPPVTSFTRTPAVGAVGTVVTGTDTSTNTPTSWDWDWGDGTAHSTTQNPTHQYTKPGIYTISMVATNASGSGDAATATVTITPAGPPGGLPGPGGRVGGGSILRRRVGRRL